VAQAALLPPHQQWRQEVGGSSIEASKIAGNASTKITEEYTVVQLRRQDELARRIQQKLAKAARQKPEEKTAEPVLPVPAASEVPPSLADAAPVTPTVQWVLVAKEPCLCRLARCLPPRSARLLPAGASNPIPGRGLADTASHA